jgi:predicted nuclease with RNAse H fold
VWFGFFAALVLVLGVFAWDYRKKAAKRAAVSQERLEQLLKEKADAAASAQSAPALAPTEPSLSTVAGATAVVVVETPPAIAYTARERLLAPGETLVYFLLKSGVPDYETLPKVTLASLLSLPGTGYDREQQIRRLSRHPVDFVVCDKSMKIVAAVELVAHGAEAVMAQRFRAECLKSAGIPVVTIDPAAPPKRAELRALISRTAGPAV